MSASFVFSFCYEHLASRSIPYEVMCLIAFDTIDTHSISKANEAQRDHPYCQWTSCKYVCLVSCFRFGLVLHGCVKRGVKKNQKQGLCNPCMGLQCNTSFLLFAATASKPQVVA